MFRFLEYAVSHAAALLPSLSFVQSRDHVGWYVMNVIGTTVEPTPTFHLTLCCCCPCCVILSVKLMSRIVAPTENEMTSAELARRANDHESMLHDHTYGITSDPLTQFACLFSALIHDGACARKSFGVVVAVVVARGMILTSVY